MKLDWEFLEQQLQILPLWHYQVWVLFRMEMTCTIHNFLDLVVLQNRCTREGHIPHTEHDPISTMMIMRPPPPPP